jgi:hypothetical protein
MYYRKQENFVIIYHEDRAMVEQFAEAGVTWWQEGFDWSYSLEQVRMRIRLGPAAV